MNEYECADVYISERQQDPYRAVMNGIIANIYATITVLAYVVAQDFFSRIHEVHAITYLSTLQPYALETLEIIGLFIGTTYAWLFFSRILVFIEESEFGELTSVGLAFIGLITPLVIAAAGKDMFLVGLVMSGVALLAWLGKCEQVRISLKKDKSNGEPHPLCAEAKKWTLITFVFLAGLILYSVDVFFCHPSFLIKVSIPLVVALGFILTKFTRTNRNSRFRRYEDKVKEKMEKFLCPDISDSTIIAYQKARIYASS